MKTLFDCLPEKEKRAVLKTKRLIAKGSWVSNTDAQRAHDSERTLEEIRVNRIKNGFQ